MKCSKCGQEMPSKGLFSQPVEAGNQAPRAIWDYYQGARLAVGKKGCQAKTYKAMEPKILTRLKGFREDQIKDAISQLFKSKFHVDHGFIGLEYVVGSDSKVQRWLDIAEATRGELDYSSMVADVHWEDE